MLGRRQALCGRVGLTQALWRSGKSRRDVGRVRETWGEWERRGESGEERGRRGKSRGDVGRVGEARTVLLSIIHYT